MSDESQVQTVLTRMVRAGMTEERVRMHFENKVISLDGEVVSDLDQAAPEGTRIVVMRS